MSKVKDVIEILESFAPSKLAADWDNVGLQVGKADSPVETILVTLDVTEKVIEEAAAKEASLIISHHPVTRGNIKSVNFDNFTGRRLWMAANSDISVFVMHTNLDACPGGVNDILAKKIGLEAIEILQGTGGRSEYKLVCFVPLSHLDVVTEAIVSAGGGVIGDYTRCTFRIQGTGTFKPGAKSRPFVGNTEEISEVEEIRLETRVSDKNIGSVVAGMLEAHPYEEVAYDVYSLIETHSNCGWGRIGRLKRPLFLNECVKVWREKLQLKNLKVCGNPSQRVEWVAVCGGSGGNLISIAKERGAQALITGDVKYHDAQLAEFYDLAIIDAGHYHTERQIVPKLASFLKQELKNRKEAIKVLISEVNTNPWLETDIGSS